MRLKIIICEDNTEQTELLISLVREWAKTSKTEVNVTSYDSAESFLFAYESDKQVDILLLDIQMKQLDGVTLAKQLRQAGGQMQIVFVTGLPDFIANGYDVSALHYLIKPVCKEKLFAVLDKAVEQIGKTDAAVCVETEHGQVRLFHRDIEYAEAFAHTTSIHTFAGNYKAHISIGELEAELGDAFFRSHRSYLVGLRYVRQISKTTVILDNGETIPLSRRRYDEANKAFIEFYSQVK